MKNKRQIIERIMRAHEIVQDRSNGRLVSSKTIILHFTGKERPMSTHKRIYKPGGLIKSMDGLAKWLDSGRYIFFRGKSYHPGWARGFQFGYILWNLKVGRIRKAVKI